MAEQPDDAPVPEEDERPSRLSPHAIVWARVEQLWRMVSERDMEGMRAALHPRYTGWEHGALRPHELEHAIRSVGPDAPAIRSYQLQPWRVRLFGETVAIVHYAFRAQVVEPDENGLDIERTAEGTWTEVYLNEGGTWLLAATHGGAD
ncbi:MAG: nuclear transport factor 2 family protein [Acidobacteriota bacterium]